MTTIYDFRLDLVFFSFFFFQLRFSRIVFFSDLCFFGLAFFWIFSFVPTSLNSVFFVETTIFTDLNFPSDIYFSIFESSVFWDFILSPACTFLYFQFRNFFKLLASLNYSNFSVLFFRPRKNSIPIEWIRVQERYECVKKVWRKSQVCNDKSILS